MARKAMDGLGFLEGLDRAKVHPIFVVVGEEDFLRRQVRTGLGKLVLGGRENLGLSCYAGDKMAFATLRDELGTASLLGGRRLVLVEQADSLVTRERSRLENYFTEPSKTGVLVLEVKSWNESTRLAQMVPASATIRCEPPGASKLAEWCVQWSQRQHAKPLTLAAARLLVELVGTDMGLLDQEMAKLAAYVGDRSRIDAPDVDRLVANNRTEKTWKIFDLIGGARPGEALVFLDQLLDQGEDPLRLLGAFSSQVRQIARVARLCGQGASLAAALKQGGVPPFNHRNVEQQLHHLGRRRWDQLYDWLLEVDQGLKGWSQLPARVLLERLVVLLARSRS